MSAKRFNRMHLILLVMFLVVIFLSLLSYSQTPTPHNVRGRVFTNSSNGVQNGIPVLLNDTANGNKVLTAVSAPPPPPLRGLYAATINGLDGDLIVATAWNATHFGNATGILLPTTTIINIILNMTRSSEANVSIILPLNNSLHNKSIQFNLTVNVTMMGNDGINCNATLNFTDRAILNVTTINNATKELGNIPFQTHRMVNWTVVGLSPGNANLSVTVLCESDFRNLEGLHKRFRANITVINQPPLIRQIRLPGTIDLISSQNSTQYCNATVEDGNTVSDILMMNGTLFQHPLNYFAPDDRNNHYTNSSCVNISSSVFEMNISCTYPLAYFANNGTWRCNITVMDASNISIANASNTTVNELIAVDINPGVIDYGALAPYAASPDDVNVTVSNIGNIPFNVSVYGYARSQGDGLSMNCTKGNITVNNTRFSVISSTAFSSMVNLSATEKRVQNITFPQRTNDIMNTNDTNTTYWKLEMPGLVSGTCNGTVVFKTIIT